MPTTEAPDPGITLPANSSISYIDTDGRWTPVGQTGTRPGRVRAHALPSQGWLIVLTEDPAS